MNKFKLLIEEFLDSNTIEKGNSENTKNAYKNDLNQFNSWVKSKNIPYFECFRRNLLCFRREGCNIE